ncbi:acyl-CoA synthetase [bacterium (Candidatus Howlettbacteria) CG_4_10_14_0_8_um_filter_40_9]|nr:MAG: acyl-CoA synthetase [bacterium (Candidatus Howlettbacteria) CG_4_10_14_0_8_um_filter_40_9]
MASLDFFFKPKSIAVIGASSDKTKLGHMVLNNIQKYHYKGRIYPISLHDKKILGLSCRKSVLDVAGEIDLAAIVIPAALVPDVIEECGKKGVKGVIIISAGFKETGAIGGELEEKVQNIAKKYGMRVLGPNCLGLIDTSSKLNASFAESMPEKWSIAVFSQSGAMSTAILDWANANGIGFSKMVSLGNKTDITECDLLEAWQKDDSSKVILGYLEGIEDGDRFLSITRKITKEKPLIVIKAGSSDEGTKAISSHTGSLAGYDQAAEAAFVKAGIIRARTIQDLFDYCKAFSFLDVPKGNKVAIITNAGGPGVMTTDLVDGNDFLEMSELSQKTKRLLKKTLPSSANIKNPIDVIGDAKADRFKDALEVAEGDRNVDMVVVILTPQVMTEVEKTAELIAKIKKKTKKPIIASFIGGETVAKGIAFLEKEKVPVYDYPERAIKSLEALVLYSQYLKSKDEEISELRVGFEKAKKIFKETKGQLIEVDVLKVLSAYGIPVSDSILVNDKEAAVKAARKVGFPAVLKIASPDILHKTDIGGVKLAIQNEKEVRQAYGQIMKSVKAHMPKARIKGVTVFHMVREGQEVIIGGKRDDIFGPMVMFGLGGVYVELLKDVVFQLCPITKKKALKMILSIKASSLLTGYRGQWACDIDAIADAIVRLSQLMIDFPEIKEVDINPLRVNKKGQGALALDAKIVL